MHKHSSCCWVYSCQLLAAGTDGILEITRWETCWHIFALKWIHTFHYQLLIQQKCVRACMRVCPGRDDISCITACSLFDLSSFIFSAKKPDIIGSFSALLLLRFEVCVCMHGCQQGKLSSRVNPVSKPSPP